MEQAKGTVEWIDDELVCFRHDCGAKAIVMVGIYKDSKYECECGKKFILEQTNSVYEIND